MAHGLRLVSLARRDSLLELVRSPVDGEVAS
jgi:hypothetical protein